MCVCEGGGLGWTRSWLWVFVITSVVAGGGAGMGESLGWLAGSWGEGLGWLGVGVGGGWGVGGA